MIVSEPFAPRKVGFLAWEGTVKLPGKPRRNLVVRAWTESRLRRKIESEQLRLKEDYIERVGESEAQASSLHTVPSELETVRREQGGAYPLTDKVYFGPHAKDLRRQ